MTRRSTSVAADVDGTFDIKNVPDGTYQLSIWDDDQDYILWSFNVDVSGGQLTDVGNKMIVGWFTHVHGKVFIDSNGNGKQDPGEKGVPQFPLTVRERDNSLMDQATNTASTQSNGSYDIRETYPLGKWLILEAFNTRYQTTGITYKGENETKATTQLGSLVDINFLPIIGLGGEIDWGVQPYDAGTNGGIVGTVTYDTTRNELDPADAATESYQPGIPDVPVNLYAPVPCTAAPADQPNLCRQGYEIVPLQVPDPARLDEDDRQPGGRPRRVRQGPAGAGHLHLGEVGGAARLHRAPVQRRPADRPAGTARVRHGREPALRRGADDGRRRRPE